MVLVDSSIWIDYFKGDTRVEKLNELIDTNQVCINDAILAELLPAIQHKKELVLAGLLQAITRLPLEINWEELVQMQTINLKKGINKIGVVDLIIAQNALQQRVKLYSSDRHFQLMSDLHGLRLFS